MSGLAADAAWLGPMPWLPVLAPVWPLALLALLVLPPLRGAVARLAPWAPLPALLIAATAPQSTLPLPGLMLGGSFQLDDTGRWLLAAVALLWLAGGWLARDWLCRPRRTAAWLLAMAGALWLPLTGDMPSALAASVLAVYPLYGLLGGGRGGRALLASVIIADLLILEAVLLLAKGGAGLDFESLRAALAEAQGRDVVLALMLLGFGAKAGLMGLHYWLPPTLVEARSRLLGSVVAFTLVAGLLPWLRLVPVDGLPWPAAALLPWLALAGCGAAAVAGLLQAAPRALTAYTLSALATLWLGFGLGLHGPVSAARLTDALPAGLALSGVGVGALLLAGGTTASHGRLAGRALALFASLPVALAVLGAALAAAAGGDAVHWPLLGSLVCVGMLLGASATAAAGGAHLAACGPTIRASALLVTGGLVMATAVVFSLSDALPPPAEWPGDRIIALSGALLGGIAAGPLAVTALSRLPRVPAGDLLLMIERVAAGLVAASQRLEVAVGHWRDRLDAVIGRLRWRLGRLGAAEATEAWLRRWSTATLLLLVAGVAVALLARPG
jgi:formate hydrogenlyase subunit 3/multisubunit Na+/H+ antiporter MnhD subunit